MKAIPEHFFGAELHRPAWLGDAAGERDAAVAMLPSRSPSPSARAPACTRCAPRPTWPGWARARRTPPSAARCCCARWTRCRKATTRAMHGAHARSLRRWTPRPDEGARGPCRPGRACRTARAQAAAGSGARVIPAGPGGPKGTWCSTRWTAISSAPGWRARRSSLLGASIGAWRMATACLPEPTPRLPRWRTTSTRPTGTPRAGAGAAPRERGLRRRSRTMGTCSGAVLGHPRRRAIVFTSPWSPCAAAPRPAPLSRISTPLGYLGAFASNAVSRRSMGTLARSA